jgi:pilus assembly protein Flp/PilA
MSLLAKLWKDESGQGMVEYGLILALVSVVVIATLATIGTTIKEKFGDVKTELDNATPGT